MKLLSARSAIWLDVILLIFVNGKPAFAQEAHSIELPNPMSIHTWFIIGAVGAFFAWSISYALQLQKEALERRKDHADLRLQREQLLDKLAELEQLKESGQISEQRYKHERKDLRSRLAKVIEQMTKPEAQKSAKKTS